MSATQPPASSAAKLALRDQLLTARRRLSLASLGLAARELSTLLLASTEVRRAATVACYVSRGSEPGTGPLLSALTDAGKRVVLPRLQPDGDLDWSAYRGPSSLAPAPRGLLEPLGPLLGPASLATADVVLVPGLAVSSRGDRLGRGGGSYDRVLGRVPVGTPVCVLLFADEVGVDVPVEPHDRPVTHACSPTGLVRLR